MQDRCLYSRHIYYLQYQFISEILRWRAQSTADHVIFTLLNSKGAVATVLSCSQLHKKAERVGNLLLEKGKINTGDHVALIFPPGIDLICAFYGCLYVGKSGYFYLSDSWSVHCMVVWHAERKCFPIFT